MMRSVKAELEKNRTITYELLGRYTNQSASAALEKFHRPHQPQVEGLISLLERLPAQVRHQLLDKACRCFPTLSHPRLAHDPVQVSQLRTLLGQTCGYTLIQGANAGARTFVISALGHQMHMAESGGHSVSGVDVHQPDWFVPVDGVLYLNNAFGSKLVRQAVIAAWNRIQTENTSLVLLNGIWGERNSIWQGVFATAKKSHVVAADESALELPQLAGKVPEPIHLVKVSADSNDRIKVVIEGA